MSAVDQIFRQMRDARLYAELSGAGAAWATLDRASLREGRLRRRLCAEAGKLGLTDDGQIVKAIEEAVEI